MFIYIYQNDKLMDTVMIDDTHIFDIGEIIVSAHDKYGQDCLVLASRTSEEDPLNKELIINEQF